MPYYHFKQIYTPLLLVGVRFYKDEHGHYWIKVRNNRKRRITGDKNIPENN
ncbi:hypothetical protein [Aneurinibacillus tyrosinisolvens]|uniref:hypothetical protein n=1 Tax=Aneurinibacillus tyrosinisolvens TaxID=1443435 RepID=UPI000AC3DDAA|nr:hypothetical protein [Aneurinibacillus tyrosinisolvens]